MIIWGVFLKVQRMPTSQLHSMKIPLIYACENFPSSVTTTIYGVLGLFFFSIALPP